MTDNDISILTHLPLIINHHDTHSRRMIWVDRVTGEETATVCNTLDLPLREWAAALGMTQAAFDEMISSAHDDTDEVSRVCALYMDRKLSQL
jgi:hypothetical protein